MDPFLVTAFVFFLVLVAVVALWKSFHSLIRWLLFTIGLMLCYAVYWLVSPPTIHWPAVADPAKIRHEANLLCQKADPPLKEEEKRLIPKSDWPESIRALKPKFVVVKRDYVNVVFVNSGQWGYYTRGYAVYPDTIQREDGGIRKYEITDEGASRSR